MKKSLIQSLYGIICVVNKQQSIGLFNRVKFEYNNTTFEKRVFKCMEGILKRNESIDLLSLMNEFRANGWMDKGTPVDISNLTSTNFTTESMVHAENLFLELENQLMFQRAMMIRNQIDVAVTSENLTLDRFHEILEIGNGIQFKRADDEKNVDLIHSVIDDTISAAKGEKTGLDLCYSLLSEKVL